MREFLINIFESYPFLQTEWFYGACSFLLGLVSAIFALGMWRKDVASKLEEEKKQTIWQQVQSDMRMDEAYRASWSKIASFKGDAKENIFHKELNDIHDDEIRVCINQIIMILHNVFGYYRMLQIPLETTQWMLNFNHVFNPKEMQVFISAFRKYEKERKLRPEFLTFVNNLIELKTK